MSDFANYESAGSYTPEVPIASDYPVVADKVTLASGQNLPAGTGLGKITVGGKYTESLAASNDGSEVIDVFLAYDTDASTGDAEAMVYVTGHFKDSWIKLGTGHTVASTQEGLRQKGLHIGR